MARPLRTEAAGIPCHLMIRGNNRENVFIDTDCFNRYMEILKGYKERFGYKLYCYCLILNHIHLLIEASEKALISKIMQCVNTSFTMYYNKKFGRTGHVFEGRYKSKVIKDDRYLLGVSRYIHRNPLKHGLCQDPRDYKYSSIKRYLPNSINDGLVDADFILKMLNTDIEMAKREYEVLVMEGVVNIIRV